MKSRGMGSHSAFVFGVNSLVAFLIFLVRFSFDIFRKRGFAEDLEHFAKFFVSTFPKEADGSAAAGGIVNDFSNQFVTVAEIEFVSYTDLTGRINDYVP